MNSPRAQNHNNDLNDPSCLLDSLDSTDNNTCPGQCDYNFEKITSSNITDDAHQKSSASTDGQEAAALEDANLRGVWQNIMKDFGLTGMPHRSVAVLMLSWADELDDLKTMEEVEKLKGVFRDDFNYKVVQGQLRADKRPGVQVAMHLTTFIFAHDSDSTLLIVYYAGHGIPGENSGELYLAGRRLPNQPEHTIDNSAAWHEYENIIRDAKGDVLLIFDCCYAGNLIPRNGRSYYSSRSFEIIAACGKKAKTAMPGEDSFTSALIWALKSLVADRKKFTTLELQTKIMNGPHFPKNQFVPVGEGHEPCDQRLTLAPLPLNIDNIFHPATSSSQLGVENPQNSNDYYLDLRFWYSTQPSKNEIESLAKRFRRLMSESLIGSHRIEWCALKNVDIARREIAEIKRVRPAAEKWTSIFRQRKASTPAPTIYSDGSPTWKVSSEPQLSAFRMTLLNGSTDSESHKLGKVQNDSTGSVDPVTAAIKENGDSFAIKVNKAVESKLSHTTENQMSISYNLKLTKGGYRGAVTRRLQQIFLVLRVVAVLALGAYTWYFLPSLPLPSIKNGK